MENNQNYDVIIIGSGISGLTSASILSQLFNKRVLVLERHFKPGGFTHVFKRKGSSGTYVWDVGLHYVGEMQNGTMPRAVFDYVTQGKVKWQKINDPFDIFVFPGFHFGLKTGKVKFKRSLINLFPLEKAAIEKYFYDLKKTSRWSTRYHMAMLLPGNAVSSVLKNPGSKLALMTTKEYMDRTFSDDKLKALLVSQWGDHGLPPSRSTFHIHSVIANHYMNGGYYPAGTSKSIADSIIPIVELAGGDLFVNHEVKEIIVDNNKAVGVKAIEKLGGNIIEKEFFADTIISCAGAEITYSKLLNAPFAKEVEKFPSSQSHVTLHLGFNDDPRKLGFNGENYWIYSSYDHEDMFNKRNDLLKGNAASCFFSFPSLKDPEAKDHTAEIIAFIDYELFAQWANKPWKKRGNDYNKIKKMISETLLNFVDDKLKNSGVKYNGGLKDIIDYAELSTPLSTEFFTGYKNGAIYGIPATKERYNTGWIGIKTPYKNLYMTGADATSHGITGALMSGALTVGYAFSGILKIYKESMAFHQKIIK